MSLLVSLHLFLQPPEAQLSYSAVATVPFFAQSHIPSSMSRISPRSVPASSPVYGTSIASSKASKHSSFISNPVQSAHQAINGVVPQLVFFDLLWYALDGVLNDNVPGGVSRDKQLKGLHAIDIFWESFVRHLSEVLPRTDPIMLEHGSSKDKSISLMPPFSDPTKLSGKHMAFQSTVDPLVPGNYTGVTDLYPVFFPLVSESLSITSRNLLSKPLSLIGWLHVVETRTVGVEKHATDLNLTPLLATRQDMIPGSILQPLSLGDVLPPSTDQCWHRFNAHSTTTNSIAPVCDQHHFIFIVRD